MHVWGSNKYSKMKNEALNLKNFCWKINCRSNIFSNSVTDLMSDLLVYLFGILFWSKGFTGNHIFRSDMVTLSSFVTVRMTFFLRSVYNASMSFMIMKLLPMKDFICSYLVILHVAWQVQMIMQREVIYLQILWDCIKKIKLYICYENFSQS